MTANPSPTKSLGRFAAELEYEQIPQEVVDHAKLCMLDTLGCGLFGASLPWVRIVADFAQELGGPAEATVWGTRLKLPAANAVLVNGTAVHAFELDDLHKTSILHPGGPSVSAALATAERLGGCDGKRFLTAVIAGYESGIRVGMSVGTTHLQKGFHPTGTHGTFSAGAASGRMLRLTAEQMAHAFGIAGTQAAGSMAAQYAAMVKRFHAGRASQSGVYGALLAQKGLTGITNLLEADFGGYGVLMGDNADLSLVTARLGEYFETINVGFKPYAAGGSTHTAHEAVKAIMAEQGLTAADIEGIIIRCTTATDHHTNWQYKPEGVTAAQMNMQYVVTVTALDGELFIDQFSPEKLTDPGVIAFTRKVTVQRDPELDALGANYRHAIVAEITTSRGQTHKKRVDTAKGSYKYPMSKEEVLVKYMALAARVISADAAQTIQDMVLNIEQISDVADLSALLRG